MIDATREDRLEQLFHEASAMLPAQRARFLDDACVGDPQLRSSVEGLLADRSEANDFMDRVASHVVARYTEVALGGSGSAARDRAGPRSGDHIAHFRIVEKLGGGGMGVVYRAVDVRLGRTVALKFLPPHLDADDDAKQRFVREARAASALDHPNICAVHEIGETSTGQLFIAMACYDGLTLKQRIEHGPLPINEAVSHAKQVAEGLRRAHEAGIVHRDIKPANVIVTDRGQVRIVDFGLAKMIGGSDLTRERATRGTIAYMSPEQTRSPDVDARTDIWSLGILLYEMLTGQRPFRGENDETLIFAIRHDDPRPMRDVRADVPAALDALVGRCLDKNLSTRYQSAGELLADLAVVEQSGAVARPIAPNASRKRRFVYLGGALLFSVLSLGGGLLLTRSQNRAHAEGTASVKPEALALYLQAERLPSDVRLRAERQRLLEQAIEKDSSFALPYARVAIIYILFTHERGKAEWAISRALVLDPSSSRAYASLGLLKEWMDWDWPAAEAALRRSIALNSYDGRAHHELGQLLMRLGRCDEAVSEERRAMSVEPSNIGYQSGIAEVYLYCRRFDDALREFPRQFQLGGDSSKVYWDLAETYFGQGRYRDALTMYEKSRRPVPGWAYAALGSRTQALQEIEARQAEVAAGKADEWTYWNLAQLNTSLGKRAEAIAWLERLYEERSGLVVYLKVQPHFDPLRAEPRFQALMKKIGLGD